MPGGPPLWRHVAILVVGTLFMLVCAFHGNIWFDETYSVALASKPFAEIWRIGATDVHPVLYYCALHVIYLALGTNVLAYRLFSLLGIVCVALLGLTHLRRDYGARTGELFSLLVLFTPYLDNLALQIRMYSWVIFTVTACFVYACRIVRAARASGSVAASGIAGAGGSLAISEAAGAGGAPRGASASTWAVFFLTSLASAYLHYFGAMSAFLINLVVLVALVRARRARMVATLLVGAVAQVALYLPWLLTMTGQVSSIAGGNYWIDLDVKSAFKLPLYMLFTDSVLNRVVGDIAVFPTSVRLTIVGFAFVVVGLFVACAVSAVRGALAARRGAPAPGTGPDAAGRCRAVLPAQDPSGAGAFAWRACAYGVVVYLGVIAIAVAASYAIGTLIVYYRYLAVPLGALLVSLSVVLARVRARWLAGAASVALVSFACLSQMLTFVDYYTPVNRSPYNYVEELATDRSSLSESLPVLAGSISSGALTSIGYPDVRVTFAAWLGGYWGDAYEAYQPTLAYADDVSQTSVDPDDAGSMFVYVTDSDSYVPVDLSDVEASTNSTAIESRTYYRPYDAHYVQVALMRVVDTDADNQTDDNQADVGQSADGQPNDDAENGEKQSDAA